MIKVVRGSRLHLAGRYGALAVILLIAVAIPFNSSTVLNGQLTLVMIYGIAALGLNLLVGYTGQISLGHGAFFAIGAYTTGALIAKGTPDWFPVWNDGVPYLFAILAAPVVTL